METISKTINLPVPFVDLTNQCNELAGEVMPAIESVIRRGQFILGDEVQEFEEKFADYCETDYCVSVASGTEALHLALRAIGVGPGDEVITAGNSFVATAYAISHAGAMPVLVDINACGPQYQRRTDRTRHYHADQGDHSGASLRPAGRDGRHQADCRKSRIESG